MPFEVVVHREDRILEVIYPPNPTPADIADYSVKVRAGIEEIGPGDWSSLVDQSELQSLPSELFRAVMQMNLYASNHGMVRTARVVVDAVASLQASRIGRDTGLSVPIQTFPTREDAIAWIKAETGS